MHDWQAVLDELYLKYKDLDEGKVANYIPELAKVDPSLFGKAVVTVDGECYTAGDWEAPVRLRRRMDLSGRLAGQERRRRRDGSG